MRTKRRGKSDFVFINYCVPIKFKDLDAYLLITSETDSQIALTLGYFRSIDCLGEKTKYTYSSTVEDSNHFEDVMSLSCEHNFWNNCTNRGHWRINNIERKFKICDYDLSLPKAQISAA